MEKALQLLLSDHFYNHILFITLFTAAILLAMAIDLICGIHKARIRGDLITSRGLKMTGKKAVKYFVPFFVLCLLDLVACFLLPAPFFSMFWSSYCLLCEFWSVRESSWQKEEIEKQARTIRTILADKDDLARLIANALSQRSSTETAPPAPTEKPN